MTTKVTLDINEKLAEKAKKYAEEQGQSLSDLVETFLADVTEPKGKALEKITPKNPELVKRILDGTEPIPESLKKLYGILEGYTENELNEAKYDYLKKKYGD
ncbi:DUF6364 family protein [Algoriphagus aquimarinus]|uniref:DUF6364 family protein n=1 Tax=Algoriphagus aquimarinus TaxID=237018 RepID=UPI0030D94BAE|tara:strand:- start:5245 stop:5550 length:306 start_codon:yes stop_codon:yes gene_type:complete